MKKNVPTRRIPQREADEQTSYYKQISTFSRRVKLALKCSYNVNWQQKGIGNDPANLSGKLSQNIHDIRWRQKLYRKKHGNMENGIDSRREELSRNQHPMILGRRTITITICKSDDATQPHTQEMYKRIKHFAEKEQSTNVYGRHQIVGQKWKKNIANSNTGIENILSGHRNEIRERKIRNASNEKRKRHMTDRKELPNQEKLERSEKKNLSNTLEYWKQTPLN